MAAPPDDFEALCRQEYPRLVGALSLYTGDREVAEDLAQESLARAWTRWRQVSEADNPAAWLFVVGYNLAKSHVRRLRIETRARFHLSTPDRQSEADPAETADVKRALAALPHRYRSVLVLRYYLGLSLGEISTHLNVPLSTVKTWSARGLERLREDGLYELKEALDVI